MTTSLCYVARPTNGTQIWMTRIADWNGRTFQLFRAPIAQRPAVRTRDTADRIPIYQDSSFLPLADREIGVWDWEIDERGRITVRAYREDIVPVQVIPSFVGQNLSPVQIASKLKSSSFSVPMHSGKLAILTSKDDGFVIDRGMADHFMPGFQLNQECMKAPHFIAAPRTLRVDFWAADGTHVIFSMFEEPPLLDGQIVLLDERIEVVRRFFVENLTKKTLETASVTRTERQRFMDILSKIDLHSMSAALAEYLGCDEDIAKREIDAFMKRIGSVDVLGGNDELLNEIVEANPAFKQKCLTAGEKRWKQSNEAIVAHEKEKVDKRIDEEDFRLKLKLADNQAIVNKLDHELKTKQAELSRLEAACEAQNKRKRELETTIPEAENAVAEKLKKIRDDFPAAFAEIALLRSIFGVNDPSQESKTTTGYSPGKQCDGPCEQFQDFANARKALSANLKNAGASKADLLSAWLCACAGSAGINLLLAGPRAESIATAFSVSIFGATPGVLDCAVADVASGEESVSVDSSPVCIVRSPFEPKWVGRIPGLLERNSNNRRFILCTPFAEDLAVEPESLFHGIVPVLTEPFAFGPATNAFKPGKIADGVVLRETTAGLAIPDGLSIRSWLLDAFKRVFSKAKSLQSDTDGMLQSFLVWLPLAAISGNATIVADAIQAEKMTFSSDPEKVRSELLSFLS